MKKVPWLLAFLMFMMPITASAQVELTRVQDIHALGIITQSLEKIKQDIKRSQDRFFLKKTYKIENLSADGKFESNEKEVVFNIYSDKNKVLTQKTEKIDPPGSSPPDDMVKVDELLDKFVSRYYFWINPEQEADNHQTVVKVYFWPRSNMPDNEYSDNLINRIRGEIHIDKKTDAIVEIRAFLVETISKNYVVGSFYMDKFDLSVQFQNWNGLNLPATVNAIAKYSYRDPRKSIKSMFSATKRYQKHIQTYEYSVKK